MKNVIFAAALFRRSIQNGGKKCASEHNLSALDANDATSVTSLDRETETNYFSIDFFAFDKLRGRFGNFGRQSERNESNLRASVGSLTSVGANENNTKNLNGNGKEHEIDPHTHQRITAENIELIKEPRPPEQDENDSQNESTIQSSGTNGTMLGHEDSHIITKDNIDLAVNGNTDGDADDEDDDKTSPKKYYIQNAFRIEQFPIILFSFCNRVSPRTPVTQNDPLGALVEEEEELIKIEKTGVETKNSFLIKNNTIYTDQPILFRGQRSATFDESTPMYKSMQRSKTMPPSSVTSSLAGFSQSLKLNFG